jgi:hypothetical protein
VDPSKRPLVETAALVADGGTPDWDRLEAAADERTRALIGRLRTLADIAHLHGTLSPAGYGAAPVSRRALEQSQTWGARSTHRSTAKWR